MVELGSVTKAVTGLLLADAVVRGEVALARALAACLPGARPGITLERLATHTAGLPRVPLALLRRVGFLDTTDPYARTTVAELVDDLARVRIRRRGRPRYSNLGAALLGQALAAAPGTGLTPSPAGDGARAARPLLDRASGRRGRARARRDHAAHRPARAGPRRRAQLGAYAPAPASPRHGPAARSRLAAAAPSAPTRSAVALPPLGDRLTLGLPAPRPGRRALLGTCGTWPSRRHAGAPAPARGPPPPRAPPRAAVAQPHLVGRAPDRPVVLEDAVRAAGLNHPTVNLAVEPGVHRLHGLRADRGRQRSRPRRRVGVNSRQRAPPFGAGRSPAASRAAARRGVRAGGRRACRPRPRRGGAPVAGRTTSSAPAPSG